MTDSEKDRIKRTSRSRAGIGWVLIACSGVSWFSMLAVPLLDLPTGQKASLAVALFVLVQISWWIGAAFVGQTVVNRILSMFGWKSRTTPPSAPENSDEN